MSWSVSGNGSRIERQGVVGPQGPPGAGPNQISDATAVASLTTAADGTHLLTTSAGGTAVRKRPVGDFPARAAAVTWLPPLADDTASTQQVLHWPGGVPEGTADAAIPALLPPGTVQRVRRLKSWRPSTQGDLNEWVQVSANSTGNDNIVWSFGHNMGPGSAPLNASLPYCGHSTEVDFVSPAAPATRWIEDHVSNGGYDHATYWRQGGTRLNRRAVTIIYSDTPFDSVNESRLVSVQHDTDHWALGAAGNAPTPLPSGSTLTRGVNWVEVATNNRTGSTRLDLLSREASSHGQLTVQVSSAETLFRSTRPLTFQSQNGGNVGFESQGGGSVNFATGGGLRAYLEGSGQRRLVSLGPLYTSTADGVMEVAGANGIQVNAGPVLVLAAETYLGFDPEGRGATNILSGVQAVRKASDNSDSILLHGTDRYVEMRNTAAPATPAGGGRLYVEGGALKYIGSSGTITTVGAA